MDPLTRKLFQPREARDKLRNMGGIMSSSPQLASTVAKFQQGGPIQSRGLAMPSAPDAPLPSASRSRATRVGDRTFVLTDDGRVIDAQTGAPAPQDVAAEVRSRLSPQLSMADIVGGAPDFSGGVNPSFREDTSPQLPPMPSDRAPISGPATTADPRAPFDMDAFQRDLVGAGRAAVGPSLLALDELSDDSLLGPTGAQTGLPFEGVMPYGDVGSESVPDLGPRPASRFSLSNVGPNLEVLTAPFTGRPAPSRAPVTGALDAPVERTAAETETPVAETPVADPETPPAPTIDVDLNDPSTYDTDFDEMMRRLGGATGKDDKSSRQKAMADLAMIGLAIAAGQSPDALTNIAQGALAGMKAIRAEDAAKDAVASETRALATKLATDREIARIRVPSGGGTYTPERLYQQNLNAILANPDLFDVFTGEAVDPAKARSLANELSQRGEALPAAGRIVEQNGVRYQEQPDGTFEPLES